MRANLKKEEDKSIDEKTNVTARKAKRIYVGNWHNIVLQISVKRNHFGLFRPLQYISLSGEETVTRYDYLFGKCQGCVGADPQTKRQ